MTRTGKKYARERARQIDLNFYPSGVSPATVLRCKMYRKPVANHARIRASLITPDRLDGARGHVLQKFKAKKTTINYSGSLGGRPPRKNNRPRVRVLRRKQPSRVCMRARGMCFNGSIISAISRGRHFASLFAIAYRSRICRPHYIRADSPDAIIGRRRRGSRGRDPSYRVHTLERRSYTYARAIFLEQYFETNDLRYAKTLRGRRGEARAHTRARASSSRPRDIQQISPEDRRQGAVKRRADWRRPLI